MVNCEFTFLRTHHQTKSGYVTLCRPHESSSTPGQGFRSDIVWTSPHVPPTCQRDLLASLDQIRGNLIEMSIRDYLVLSTHTNTLEVERIPKGLQEAEHKLYRRISLNKFFIYALRFSPQINKENPAKCLKFNFKSYKAYYPYH